MKKFITILLILSVAFCFTAVGCKTNLNDEQTSVSQSDGGDESGGETSESKSDNEEKSDGVIKPSPDSDWSLGEIPI